MTELVIIALLIAVVAFLAIRYGRGKEKTKTAQKAADTAKKHAEIAADAPKDKEELLDKLREKGL